MAEQNVADTSQVNRRTATGTVVSNKMEKSITVLVERKSQKGILIGKGGAMLKTIGQGARLQMQTLIDGPVYLELFVKVVPDWRSKPARLAELGYAEE